MPYVQMDNPIKQTGKGCAKSEGGKGCIVQQDGGWVILNNKKSTSVSSNSEIEIKLNSKTIEVQ